MELPALSWKQPSILWPRYLIKPSSVSSPSYLSSPGQSVFDEQFVNCNAVISFHRHFLIMLLLNNVFQALHEWTCLSGKLILFLFVPLVCGPEHTGRLGRVQQLYHWLSRSISYSANLGHIVLTIAFIIFLPRMSGSFSIDLIVNEWKVWESAASQLECPAFPPTESGW